MERDGPYALVGLVFLALVAGLVAFTVWLAQVRFGAADVPYDIDFQGPVRGLSVGGAVFFNGIRVGEVTGLSLDRRDAGHVVARARVDAAAPVKTDSTATLEPQGVTGSTYVQITAGEPGRPLLKAVTPAGVTPVIRGTPGALDSLFQSGGAVLSRSLTALDRINRLLSDRNLSNLDDTLANLRDASALAKGQGRLLSDLGATMASLQRTSAHLDALVVQTSGVIDGPGRTTLSNLNAAALQVRATTAQAQATLNRLQGPASQFVQTGLPQLTRTAATLQDAAEALDRLVGEAERDPRALLAKPPAKTVQVRP